MMTKYGQCSLFILGIYLLLKRISRTFQLLKKIFEVFGTGNWLFLAKIVTLKGDPLEALSGPNDS